MYFIIIDSSFIVVRYDMNMLLLFQWVLVSTIIEISIWFSTMLAVMFLVLSLLFEYIPFTFMKLLLVDAGSFVLKKFSTDC